MKKPDIRTVVRSRLELCETQLAAIKEVSKIVGWKVGMSNDIQALYVEIRTLKWVLSQL